MFQQKKKIVFSILGFLVFSNILAWLAVYDLSRPVSLSVVFFDIGQGDAIFIETSKGNKILIDGGPDSAILEKLGESLPFWDRTIDLIILTHPDSDHLAGLLEVLRSYKVKNILWTGILMDTADFKKWQELIKREEAEIYLAQAGQKIIISPKIVLEVLHPFENLAGKSFKNVNNTSIILKLDFGETSFLFTGDAYKSAEKELIGKGADIDSDILKIGHHGSKTSSAEEFIGQVSPEVAVISVGRNNRYNHPHPETLAVLEKYGINIFRTDSDGDVKIISNGKNYAISDF
jgi:competence protein ComEC